MDQMAVALKSVRRRYVLAGLVGSLAAAVCLTTAFRSPLGLGDSSKVYLTEDETLGVVFFANHGPAWHLYPHANPKAKPRLYELLDHPELERFHGNAYRLLGFIGDEDDVDRIQEALLNRYPDLGGFRTNSVFGGFDGLAVLAQRKMPGASEVLMKMRRPAYWKSRPRWFRSDSLDDQRQIAFYVSGAIATHQEFDGQVISIDELLEPFKGTPYYDQLKRQIASGAGAVSLPHENEPVTLSDRKVAQGLFAHYLGANAVKSPPSAVPLEEETRERILHGDPSILPFLRDWLATEGDGWQRYLAVDGLAKFGDRESLEALKAVAGDIRVTLPMRQRAARGVARMYGKDDIEALKKMVWDDQLPLAGRSEAALRLWQLNDDLGGQFLLAQYDLYRLERKTTNPWMMDSVRDALERIDDAQIISVLKDRLATESDFTMQNNINTLIARMGVNQESIDTLKERAANTAWMSAGARYDAVEVLGSKGSVDLIPFLESLQPFEGARVPKGQDRRFQSRVTEAIGEIRRRDWSARQQEAASRPQPD